LESLAWQKARLIAKVSVIIPTRNRAQLLKRAIQSILGQTYQDFEIIIVDDGSTDNTDEVAAGFRDERLRDECLNENWFMNLKHAQDIIEDWMRDYNEVRPHSPLNGRAPTEYAETATGL